VRIVVALAAASLLLAACFHSIYFDRRACNTSADCTDGKIGIFCDRGSCVSTPPDGFDFDALPDLPPQACKQSSECAISIQPICELSNGLCRKCQAVDGGTSSECMAKGADRPLCAASGACVECASKRDCVNAKKACDVGSGACVPCVTNGDCASGLCSTGSCADPAQLIYVQASGPNCPGAGSGTFDDPFCTIQAGINQGATMGKTVIVLGGTYSENVTITPTAAFSVRVVGVGQPSISPVAAGPAVRISNASHMVNVTLDGFIIQNATGAAGHGLDCGGSNADLQLTKLKVIRSTLRNNAQLGAKSSYCVLTLDQVVVGPDNKQGGISVADTDVTVMNAVVHRNGTGGVSGSAVGGMLMGSNATGKVINAVFADNLMRMGALAASGLGCTAGAIVFNVALRSNSGGMLEIDSGTCAPDHSAFVGGAVSGTNNRDLTSCPPESTFTNPAAADYRPLVSANATCTLIDVGIGTFMSTAAPAYDLEDRMRPQHGVFDIGAFEAP
jgi:hypothetical protein